MAMVANFKSGRRAAVLCNSIAAELRGKCFYGIGRIMALYGPTAARRAADCRSLTQVRAFVRECGRGGEDYLRVITEQ